jgi:NAD(P)-dependent dehydrogenase (short-subunit alcohol dehydrogenase family)
MGKLDGKIALVTGGNSGIGFATAKVFIAEGAHVYITGRRQEKLDSAVEKLGPNATGIQGDVANLADLDRLFSQIKKERGELHVVFANAGAAELIPFEQIDEAHFDRMFDGNVKGLLFTVHKALPLLSPGASIVLNSSVVGSKGLPANSVYAATKAAIRSFARTLTTDLKARGIRVNAVSPGPIDTEGLNDLLGDSEEGKARKAGFGQMVPIGRVGRPEEIANAVLFLASADSSYVTGAELFVDGGMGQV